MGIIKIMITGAGAPGIKGTIYSLKNNPDKRKIKIITTDMRDDVVGKYLGDIFYTIPPAFKKKDYMTALLSICDKEKIDIIIPQNTKELEILADSREAFNSMNTKIITSGINAIKTSNNKFELLKISRELKIPTVNFFMVNNHHELLEKAKKIGWPGKKVVVKPPVSNGLRGVRIIDESIDLKHLFYNEKPTHLFIRMNNLLDILGENFEELIVMDYLPGLEYTVDVFRDHQEMIVIPRRRELIRSGITFNSRVEKHQEIIEYTKRISDVLDLEYCFGFQYKLDENGIPKLLECNPRVQGTMVLSTFAGANLIYCAIKSILNEEKKEISVNWNSKLYRYWGGIMISGKETNHI